MRIQRVTPVSFGYSKESSAWLETRANGLKDKKLSSNILACNAMCNSMEDEIDKIEARNGKVNPTSDFVEFYNSLKTTVINTVLSVFSEDGNEYLESEYDYYSKGLANSKDKDKNWRNGVIKELLFWDANLGKTPEQLKKELEEAEEYKRVGQMQIADVLKTYGEQKEAAATSTDSNPIVETIKKNEFSPEGFKDVMGMEKLKQELTEDIVNPVNNPEQARFDFVEYGKRMPAGVLLYGPPGCGKTYIIEALSNEIETPVYIMNSANTGSKYVNQTSNNIKKAFEHVYKEGEKSQKPVLMFLDEMDAMTRRDGSVSAEDIKQVATLLKYVEEAKAHNVIVIGATNRYDMVDPAIRRRFDVKRYVGLPDDEQRLQLLKNNLKNKSKAKNLLEDEDGLKEISEMLDGYSSHSVNIISNDASLNALRRGRADISKQDFEKAIKETDEEKIDERQYLPKSKKPEIGFRQP